MRKIIIILLVCIASCQSKTDNVQLSIDKKLGVVKTSGLSAVTLQGIKRDSITTEAWQSLFPVYTMPADTSLRNYQRPLPGRYSITSNFLVFTPDTPFVSGQTYFARYYRYDRSVTAMDLVLRRRALGQGTYTELIFKY